jgi:hypothetical protein
LHLGLLQEILLGLTFTPAEKADLSLAKETKFCKLKHSFCSTT